MIDIKLLASLDHFEHLSLKKWETLLHEWDTDNHIYIITSGAVGVYKYTTQEQNEHKKLATLEKNEIIWEASLQSKNEPKQASLIAEKDTKLLKIDATAGIQNLTEQHPKIALELLKYMIHLSNKRLLLSNAQIVASYKMTQAISEITHLDRASIQWLLEKFKNIIGCDSMLYVEKNPVVANYYSLQYDSRNKKYAPDSLIQHISDINDTSLLEAYSIDSDKTTGIYPLNIGEKNIWYIIIQNTLTIMNENEEKIILSICSALAGVIHRYHILQEERNRNYLKENEKI